jgi:hypothetical protein
MSFIAACGLGPLNELRPRRSRSLIRYYNCLHRSPPSVTFLFLNSIAFISGIELILEFAVSVTRAFTLSKLVLFVFESPAQLRDRFRSLSNVNLSGSRKASKNAAAAAEKTE